MSDRRHLCIALVHKGDAHAASGNHAEAQREPSDQSRLDELRGALATAALNDRAFAIELHRLWDEVRAGRVQGDHSQTSNTISGSVAGPVVQSRDIQGGVSFG